MLTNLFHFTFLLELLVRLTNHNAKSNRSISLGQSNRPAQRDTSTNNSIGFYNNGYCNASFILIWQQCAQLFYFDVRIQYNIYVGPATFLSNTHWLQDAALKTYFCFGFNSFHRPRLSYYSLNLEGELEQSLPERYPDLLYIRGYFAMV